MRSWPDRGHGRSPPGARKPRPWPTLSRIRRHRLAHRHRSPPLAEHPGSLLAAGRGRGRGPTEDKSFVNEGGNSAIGDCRRPARHRRPPRRGRYADRRRANSPTDRPDRSWVVFGRCVLFAGVTRLVRLAVTGATVRRWRKNAPASARLAPRPGPQASANHAARGPIGLRLSLGKGGGFGHEPSVCPMEHPGGGGRGPALRPLSASNK